MESKVAAAALLLLLLAFGAEANMCYERSQTFKGRCTHDQNCVAVCATENYTGGYCHGIIRRECMCTKNCDPPPAPNPPPGNPPPGKKPPGNPPPYPPEEPPEEPEPPKEPPEEPEPSKKPPEEPEPPEELEPPARA